jgi:formylglycine-generating enzyme required for sulfatase activity
MKASSLEPLHIGFVPNRALGRLVAGAVLMVCVIQTARGATPAGMIPAGDWAREMIAARASIRQTLSIEESSWYVTGPLKAKSFGDALFPENGVDLTAESEGKPRWQRRDYADGAIHPLKAGASTSSYLYRTLVAKSPGSLQIQLGSDDGLEFWFNGERLLSKDVARGLSAGQDVVKASLRAGTNTVLLKIYNQSGDCGFYFNTDRSSAAVTRGLASRFPNETALAAKHGSGEEWFTASDSTRMEEEAIGKLLQRLRGCDAEQQQLRQLVQQKASADDPQWLTLFLGLARKAEAFDVAQAEVQKLDVASLRRAIDDLSQTFPSQYAQGRSLLQDLEAFEKTLPTLKESLARGEPEALQGLSRYQDLQRRALLANPLLDFENILLVKRRENNLGLPQNWQGNSSMNPRAENEIAKLSVKAINAPLETFYKPATNYFVGDVDLNFDADKLLFSSIGSHDRWQVFEIGIDGKGLRQVTPTDERDIDSYDAVYLPDNRIIFDSSSTFQGVPCVGGSDYVANLHLMNSDGTNIRRLCFDQDNDWYPVVLPSGRVMYSRWEYTDSAHYFSRILMSMNPDGTGQAEVYKSNSYWPNGIWYPRPIPGHPTKFVAVISGHHGVPRMGELIVFDTARGRREETGAVQRIPGYGKPVPSVIKDTLVDDSWPRFLHPYPLSDKYFLVSCKPTPSSAWGLYLVDIFDNMLLLKEEPGYALFEPLPLRKTSRPPAIADRVKLQDTQATVYVHDIYAGQGLRGVPRGTVKSLRLFQYEYSYRNQGGHYFVGMEGGWDVRRLIGTVAVEADGSAQFHVPANVPVSVQPLDAEGKALQQMRSWFVGMPGEFVSCVGCHEPQNSTTALKPALAARKPIQDPAPWRGPKRGFSFVREVQPVLDKYCVGCHNGKVGRPDFSDPKITKTSGGISDLPRSYLELHPYIRRNGPEGDYHTLTPLEFHANTSLLIQILRKGHHGVKLDAEAWDRLLTWIDINVPAYGTFHEISPIPSNFAQRRHEAKKKYANLDEDIEAIPNPDVQRVAFVKPAAPPAPPARVQLPGWPFGGDRAKRMQADLGKTDLQLDLGNGIALALKRIPAGEFPMGDVDGFPDEYPMTVVKMAQPFWMGVTEISLEQYQQFDPKHRNGYYDMHYKDQVKPGYLMDSPELPAIRISWEQAMAFCEWLSKRSGKRVLLPTEAQWEWACRAGAGGTAFYGDRDSDFSPYANLADASLSKLAVSGVDPQPIPNPDKFWDFVPKEARFNDGVLHLAAVGHYQPNAWGLRDMIGNVCEWTLDDYRAYPYTPQSAVGKPAQDRAKVVRGGSWSERPKDARASARWDYPAWQRVYNVGFRVVVLDP